MEKILENWQTWLPVITFLGGWLLPNSLVTAFGKKTGKNIPSPIKNLIVEKLDALEQGLLDSDVDGNKTLCTNDKVKKVIKETKVDLGLTE